MRLSQISQILGCTNRQNIFCVGYARGKLGRVGDRAWFLGCLGNAVCNLGSYHSEKTGGSCFFLSRL